MFIIFLCSFLGRLGNGIHNRLSTEVKNKPHLLNNRGQCKSGLEIDFVRVTRERSLLNKKFSGDSLKQFDPSEGETPTTETKTTDSTEMKTKFSFSINIGFVSFSYTRETTTKGSRDKSRNRGRGRGRSRGRGRGRSRGSSGGRGRDSRRGRIFGHEQRR